LNNSTIEFNENIGSYTLVFSRRRTIGISVSPAKGIVVRVPYRTSGKLIKEIIAKKAGWINKHLQNFASLPVVIPGKKYCEGESHPFLGKEYSLRFIKSHRCVLFRDDSYINIGLKVPVSPSAVRDMIDKWYRKEASVCLASMFREVLGKYSRFGFRPSGFAVRSMKRRWGSCTSQGKITLSTELIKVPEKWVEYVILHELCHLRHHNHGQMYYSLLSEVCPEWKKIREEMKSYIR